MQHGAVGAGLGLLVTSLIPALAGAVAIVLGIILVIIGLAGEFMAKPSTAQ